MYRTGDRAMWDRDGNLIFLGRNDDQVKIRGHRATLTGIEAAIRDVPGVRDATAILAPTSGDLIACVIAQAGAKLDPTAMREQVRKRLPDPLIPCRFVLVSRFPTTANGKLDRAALAAHPLTTFTPPTDRDERAGTPTEEALRAIWREVLFLETVGLDDNFFMLGGHSVKAVSAIARIRTRLKRALAIRDLFDHPTIRELARIVDSTDQTTATGLILLRHASTDAPSALFLPPVFGTSTVYKETTRHFVGDIACWGAQCPGFDRDEPFVPDIDTLADTFARQARALNANGPLRLVGWSMGARLAVGIAARLAGLCETRLVLIDAVPPNAPIDKTEIAFESFDELRQNPRWTRLIDALRAGLMPADFERIERLAFHNRCALAAHRSAVCLDSDIVCIEATDNPHPAGMAGFAEITRGRFAIHRVAGDHYTMFQPPHFATTARLIEEALLATPPARSNAK